MKKTKLISISLAAITTAMLFAGCGSNSENSNEISVLMPYTSEDVNNTLVAKLLEEKTGIHVNYEMLPQDKPNDKLNLIMGGGEPYDLIIMNNSKSVYANYANNNALMDLQPLIDEYAPNVKEKISQESLDMVKIEGKQFAIPNTSAAGVSGGIIIRKDWVDSLGLEMPETVDEFVAVLDAFKKENPSGNSAGTVPFVLAAGHVNTPNLLGAFGLENECKDIDGKLVMNVHRPEFKEYLKFMQDMYKNGYIDKEFATLKSTNAKERFTSGKAGAMVLNYYDMETIVSTLKKIDPESEVAYIPLLKGTDGQSGITCNTSSIDKIIFIPKSAQNPEGAMKWINAKLEDDTFREFVLGEEGVHYEVKDGEYYPIQPKFFDEKNSASKYLTGVDEEMYPKYWKARIKKDESVYNAWDYVNNSESYMAGKVASPLEKAPYIPEYDDNIQVLNTMQNDFMAKLISGNETIDSAVDNFIKEWDAEGGKALENAINKWYKETK